MELRSSIGEVFRSVRAGRKEAHAALSWTRCKPQLTLNRHKSTVVDDTLAQARARWLAIKSIREDGF